MKNETIFHVHTYRCQHASNESDEDYIESAIQCGATEIYFSDHGPFPQNPFGNRMKYEELDEYIDSLRALKERYKSQITIKIGLEYEYLPSYDNVYEVIRERVDFLLLGQHFFEDETGKPVFANMTDGEGELAGCLNGMLRGMETGMFSVVAHPERIFRHCMIWKKEYDVSVQNIKKSASTNNVLLEKNVQSYNQWSDIFWNIINEEKICLYGCDAHCTKELLMQNQCRFQIEQFKNNVRNVI